MKALYRRAQAYLASQDFVEAEVDIKAALNVSPYSCIICCQDPSNHRYWGGDSPPFTAAHIFFLPVQKSGPLLLSGPICIATSLTFVTIHYPCRESANLFSATNLHTHRLPE